MIKRFSQIILAFFILFSFSLFFNSSTADAQFGDELGAVSASIYWGTDTDPILGRQEFLLRDTTTGNVIRDSVNRGFLVPVGEYTLIAEIHTRASGLTVGQQVITVTAEQTTTVDFDLSLTMALVKGSLMVSNQPLLGNVRICPSTDDCQLSGSVGEKYVFNGNFNVVVVPGDRKVGVWTALSGIQMGELQITAIAGEMIDLAATSAPVATGQDVTATVGDLSITFTEITTDGFMTVTTTDSPQGGLAPSAYKFLGTYYELMTTATYTGSVTVSFVYDETEVKGREENLKLFHWDGVDWINITTSVDTVNNIITGISPILSPFAIGELEDITSPITTINPSGTTGNNSWYVSDVSIMLIADDSDGWGIDQTEYSLDEGITWITYTSPFIIAEEGTTLIKARSTDLAGNVEDPSVELIVNLDKINPSITEFQLSPHVVANGSSTTISVQVTDDVSGVDTVTYLLDNGTSGALAFDEITGVWQASISPPIGVYSIILEATDTAGNIQTSGLLYLAVYDPSAGFVTGGGWLIPDDTSSVGISSGGKANLGFEVKYQEGSTIPQGNLTVHYNQDSLKFKSTSMEWLAVTGLSADFQGQGMINNEGNYIFRVHIIDGEQDQFEVRIWTVDGSFDNPNYRATNDLSKGSIVIH